MYSHKYCIQHISCIYKYNTFVYIHKDILYKCTYIYTYEYVLLCKSIQLKIKSECCALIAHVHNSHNLIILYQSIKYVLTNAY